MFGSFTDLYTFQGGSVIGARFYTEVRFFLIRHFSGGMDPLFLFMYDNATPHCTAAVTELLVIENIQRMK